ncbi:MULTISPECIES: ATP-binding cassette domain-containing protein [unclassified Rhizobium]|uniref:thiamine ABC transporter ATP-binding protein n=1 Tax=unclassified Rhizobium TaxID=2613769 RepID=UPI001053B486|nr:MULTISPECIES: ATP-binding cassette domain-containing protein [unclassified Rhizobium]MBB3395977.1 thiamine transport system ATP-binding protein [Rhizobium sp. BK060]MBB4168442.1 thiamine transport system ATP-binding protein [Rhizobium sp. BK538]TCM79870.1 thiamine transport system ATP-binding protein [Rhizobium sp. BK068]
MGDPQFAIEVHDVGLQLGTQDFHFDCRLPAGAVIAVTGASGAGKSTFLNLLAGFDTAAQGRVLIAGKDVTDEYPARRPVSLIFQDNNLFAHLDIFTNIGLGIEPAMKLSTADRRSITSSLEKVGLAGFERRMPGTLSGGERQRVAFARALVRNRPVLLLDEPFAALDPGLRIGMAALLLDMHRETGNTVVVVSHDPDEVKRIADFGLFIEDGRIVVAAPIDEFLGHEDHAGLTQFLHS